MQQPFNRIIGVEVFGNLDFDAQICNIALVISLMRCIIMIKIKMICSHKYARCISCCVSWYFYDLLRQRVFRLSNELVTADILQYQEITNSGMNKEWYHNEDRYEHYIFYIVFHFSVSLHA